MEDVKRKIQEIKDKKILQKNSNKIDLKKRDFFKKSVLGLAGVGGIALLSKIPFVKPWTFTTGDASEFDSISTDTISEKTAANGVVIDSVTLKDGLVQAADGAVGAPGLSFADDTDNGIYRIGADNFGVAVAGAKAMEFDAIGAVTMPLQPLVHLHAVAGTDVTGDDTSFVPQWDEYTDQNNDFDDANTCTAPVTGTYQCNWNFQLNGITSSNTGFILILAITSNRNYSTYRSLAWGGKADDHGSCQMGGALLMDMDAGDTFTGFTVRVNDGTKVVDFGSASYMSWFLVA